mmetsp:Transcript_21161/g.58729  ORF Transcript_21161/g.58729 Transcript_21161/m.58729 type:complete len:207 (+) Transcript_21161:511-1131(+)
MTLGSSSPPALPSPMPVSPPARSSAKSRSIPTPTATATSPPRPTAPPPCAPRTGPPFAMPRRPPPHAQKSPAFPWRTLASVDGPSLRRASTSPTTLRTARATSTAPHTCANSRRGALSMSPTLPPTGRGSAAMPRLSGRQRPQPAAVLRPPPPSGAPPPTLATAALSTALIYRPPHEASMCSPGRRPSAGTPASGLAWIPATSFAL